MGRRILLYLVIAAAAIQLYRPAKTNPSELPERNIKAVLQVMPPVDAILSHSCNDCHSYKTVWPWYTNVAPVSWFVISDVNDGRRHLNFSEWAQYTPERQQGKLSQICEEVEQGEMPLKQYTWIHTETPLDSNQRKTVCDWTKAEQAGITARTGVAVPPRQRGGMQAEQKK
jgi:hypothetical protein